MPSEDLNRELTYFWMTNLLFNKLTKIHYNYNIHDHLSHIFLIQCTKFLLSLILFNKKKINMILNDSLLLNYHSISKKELIRIASIDKKNGL